MGRRVIRRLILLPLAEPCLSLTHALCLAATESKKVCCLCFGRWSANCAKTRVETMVGGTMKIPESAVSFLSSRGLRLATAESCTAGQIASYLARVPGSGSCLDVGFISYSPSGKVGFLGVKATTIRDYGLTSEEVAKEMAEGALCQEGCCADVAVSNTGVADEVPEGDPPAGTQCFAWSFRTREEALVTFSETRRFRGERNDVRSAAALYALSRIEHYFNQLPLVSRGRHPEGSC
ncbi:PncC family amidohydrolase [Paraburkholderia sp. BL17N1]|nr:PncC family amidohydrolase [Paraburkholderia sp. BL17N1]